MKRSFIILITAILLLFFGNVFTTDAQEASFYFSPSQGNYKIGDTFLVDVLINVEGVSINAAQAKIYFPPEKLKVLRISKQNSIFSLWVEEPVFSNPQGRISFLGGLPSPGFIGKAGKVITISFQSRAEGGAEISFGEEKILANDPQGTNIFSFSFSQEASFLISTPELLEIDTEPPYPFEIIVDNEGDSTNPAPLLYFETRDDISGISHYEVKIGEEDFFKVSIGETTPFRIPSQTPGNYLVMVKAIDKAGNFTESVVEVKIESILISEITICPKMFRAGEEILFVGGTALENSKVIVFFEKDGRLIKEWEVFSDQEGDWSLGKEGLFRSGIYKISAKSEDERGVRSYSSKACFLKVIFGGIAIGPWILSYKVLTLITLILLILLLSFVLYLLLRIKRTRKLIERETLDLKKKFYIEYNELRSDIEKEIEMFKNIRAERELTLEEKTRQEELLKNLIDVERVLREELKDIEEIR